MTHYIKLHYLPFPDYEWNDELSDSYNETLDLLWKENENFYEKIEDDFEDWVYYDEKNERFSEFFEFE